MDWTSAGRTSLEAPFHAAPGVAPCADRRSMGVADGSAPRGKAAVDSVDPRESLDHSPFAWYDGAGQIGNPFHIRRPDP